MKAKPKTLQQAIIHFADPDNCLKFMVARRWPKGVVCPTCGSKEVRFLSTRRLWECKSKHPRKQFSAKVGTIFEDSALPLDKWLVAMWMIANCKNGVSSYEVARSIGVTQKSAWFMLHRIRLAMQTGMFTKMGGGGKEIEADETFIGGAARFMHRDKHRRRITETGTKDKTPVMGILERGGKVRAAVVPTRRKHHVQGEIRKHVKAGSAVYTDALLSYQGLHPYYAHAVIDHAEKYVDGKVHTNGLENFWSLLKRGLKGTYVSVEPFHLFRYLDEQVFRYNMRKQPLDDCARFEYVLAHVLGKRLTYSEVTGKVGTTPSVPN
ncbi:MAG: IS1595 family transposase [Acidobacteria bacterium]|nr:IS1595 family transposase [Acidobacteriota bacterium]MCL5287639.1 IS1595 family transposase [Acidobacteriota bacterium]